LAASALRWRKAAPANFRLCLRRRFEMQMQNIHEQKVLGAALVVLGLSLGGAAGVAGLLAAEHMALSAAMCGPTLGHCIRCVAAAGLLVAALGASGIGAWLLKPRPALQRAG
jgi:hypothetical protein